MIVEIDVFSGRPNPQWEVDDGVRRKVLDIEAGLTPAPAGVMTLPGLGYRGFVYAVKGIVRRAFGGQLIRGDSTVLEDSERTMERLLLASIPAELEEVRERVSGLLA